ncbi:hypothetical protein HYPSUDRAFT_201012 [Hypholoma sublateritium FD-334 SS-4]|uniref:Uncharacterized protein n=1 Tax=Hypholoma sublateritium (strain FD-334 SS-4) TaxID=945553 RepID=A0A0D2PWL0_HYPSF|nr:hypothetical protein HYPSUDRAFT_201012 [Hypholoma sublateritium FD-334 SS-4]
MSVQKLQHPCKTARTLHGRCTDCTDISGGPCSELSDAPSESGDAHVGVPLTPMRGVQRWPGYVDSGVHPAAPRGAIQYNTALMVQANATIFAQAATGTYEFGMGTTMPSPAPEPAYARWTTPDANGAPGMVPYTGTNGAAHRRMAGGVPARQHAHGSLPATPVDWECDVYAGATEQFKDLRKQWRKAKKEQEVTAAAMRLDSFSDGTPHQTLASSVTVGSADRYSADIDDITYAPHEWDDNLVSS